MSCSNPDELLWSPPADRRTNMDEFTDFVNTKRGLSLNGSYKQLYEWSVEQYAHFWEDFYKFSGIVASQTYTNVVDPSKGVKDVPEWFSGARLNFAENLLRLADKHPDKPAVITAGEGQETRKITFSELKCRVARIVSALKSSGVQRGDKIVGYIPNCALAVEAMLACVSVGAIWSSASPDFGVTGVLDRFSQIKPKIVFSVNGVRYNNKVHMHLDRLRQVVDGLPEVECVIVMEYIQCESEMDLSGFKNAISLQTFLTGHDCTGENLEFEQVPFNHPLYIMFSSGTTGPPKCMVHSVGGTLIQHLKEHLLHGNMTANDVIIYYSTTGWMMWNWLVSALSVGSAIVLYDGSPFVPTPSVLFDLIDKVGITILGTGAKWISALQERRVEPVRTHNLGTLHTILSTGSPLKPDNFRYVYKSIKKQVCLGSISGGTDIISCFVGQNPKLPVFAGEIQGRNLGMAVESWNENREPVFNRSGELVVTKPFPCQPTHFLNDPGNNKYNKAYFSGYPDVWTHGDYCMINERTGGLVMLGRSDSTLNPSGVRFGSAEIYNIVEMNEEIEDSLCIGQPFKGDERVILFLKLSSGSKLSEELVQRVKLQIRSELSARHVPHLIYETQEIPYTTNGKKVEVAVKKVLCGEEVKSRGSLVNPDSLDLYADMYSSYLRADPN